MGASLRVDPAAQDALPEAFARARADGLTVTVCMIDGALCLPTATIPPRWADVRVRTPAGMITLRRAGTGVDLVIFDNAEAPLRDACAALARALQAK